MDIWRRSSLFPRGVHFIGAALCTLLFMLSPPGDAAPQSPFVTALGGVWDGPENVIVPEVVTSSAVGPVLVETGTFPSFYGKFRSAFGSNGFEIQVAEGLDREVDGGSIWSDGFVVTGGNGTGALNLSTRIVGSVIGHAEMFYGLFVSDNPFDLQTIIDTVGPAEGFWAVQLPSAFRVLFTGVVGLCGMPRASAECGHVLFENYQGPLDLALTGSIPFTFGQTFYVASLFGGGVGVLGGSASFFNSATFGITAPVGATLESMSGSPYVGAVPEPSAWLLFGAGLSIFGVFGRRLGMECRWCLPLLRGTGPEAEASRLLAARK